ncbi:MAG: hypothetical protein KAJ32_06615 [Gammaproteobacteria bacterium]|nr:hypothetical protein [Gammaproteobacteria bacterium]
MAYILGETADEIQVDSVDEYQRITLSLIEQARNSIDIFTQDLEAAIYDDKNIEQLIFTLSKRHPNTRIRILVQDSRRPVQDGHRLIRLAQRLTSSVFIHNPSSKYKDEQGAFMVVDDIGLIHRSVATSRTYKASANFKSPGPAAKLIDYFNTIWEHSISDVQTRRMYI